MATAKKTAPAAAKESSSKGADKSAKPATAAKGAEAKGAKPGKKK